MKPRTRKAKKPEATKKKPPFVVPDFTPVQWQAEWEEFLKARRLGLSFLLWAKQTKQWQAAWEESLKAEPPIVEQPKPKPEAIRRQGARRRDLAQSGVHLILWGTFQRVRKKSPTVDQAWKNLLPADRKKWFMSVSILCFSKDRPRIGDCIARAYLAAPDMTLIVLPALRRAAMGTTKAAYMAACYGWHDSDPMTMKNFTPAERDIRRRMRDALPEFVAETG